MNAPIYLVRGTEQQIRDLIYIREPVKLIDEAFETSKTFRTLDKSAPLAVLYKGVNISELQFPTKKGRDSEVWTIVRGSDWSLNYAQVMHGLPYEQPGDISRCLDGFNQLQHPIYRQPRFHQSTVTYMSSKGSAN